MQLEEERKSREVLENCIKEQQMKIDALNSFACSSELSRNLAQVIFVRLIRHCCISFLFFSE